MVNEERIQIKVDLDSKELEASLQRIEELLDSNSGAMTDFLGIASGMATIAANGGKLVDALGKMSNIFTGLSNPIKIVVTVLDALVGIFGVVKTVMSESGSESSKMKQRMDDLSETIQAQKKEWQDLKSAQDDQLQGDLAEIDHTRRLWQELQALLDVNGKVIEGKEQYANTIVTTISEALGIEIELIDGQIQGLDELGASIDEVIQKKEAEAKINAALPVYEEALKREMELEAQRAAKYNELMQMKEKQQSLGMAGGRTRMPNVEMTADYKKVEKELEDLDAQINENAQNIINYMDMEEAYMSGHYDSITLLATGVEEFLTTASGATTEQLKDQFLAAQQHMHDLEAELANDPGNELLKQKVESAKEFSDMAMAEWQRSLSGMSTSASQSVEDVIDSLTVIGTGLGDVSNMMSDELLQQQTIMQNGLATIRQQLENTNLSEAARGELEKLERIYLNNLGRINDELIKQGEESASQYAEGIRNSNDAVNEAAESTVGASVEAGSEKAEESTVIGENIANGIGQGMMSQLPMLLVQAVTFVTSLLGAIRSKSEINSPSKLFAKEVGEPIALGVAKGIEDSEDEAIQAARDLAEKTFQASKEFIDQRKYYNQMGLAEELLAWQRVAAQYVEGCEQRIEAEKEVYRVKKEITEELKALEQEYADAVESRAQEIYNSFGLFDEVMEEEDALIGEELLDNLAGQVDALEDWRNNLSELAARGIDEGLLAELEAMGPEAAAQIKALLELSDDDLSEYVDLWREKHALAREQAVEELEWLREETQLQIDELLLGVDEQFEQAPSIGLQLSNGLADGIRAGKSGVINAAIAVAAAAMQAARDELEVESPSKKFMKIGLQSDEGWAKGMMQGIGQVRQASAAVAAASLPSAVMAGNLSRAAAAKITNHHTIVREKVVGVQFTGSGAEIARMLRPKLLQEEKILGKSFLPVQV